MNNVLAYLEYQGSIEISIEDGCLHGRILHIDDIITYEGDTLPGLDKAFKNAVDIYIKHCNETGKAPNKPYSGTFNVRIGPDLHKAATQCAYAMGKKLNEFVRDSVGQAIEKIEKPDTIHHQVTVNHVVHHEMQIEVPYSTGVTSSWQQASQAIKKASVSH